MKRSEFCDLINPIQIFSVTFKSLKYARLASYLTPLSTENQRKQQQQTELINKIEQKTHRSDAL